METRMSRYQSKRDLIDSENQLIAESNVASNDAIKVEKSFSSYKKKMNDLVKSHKLNSTNLDDVNIYKNVNSDSLYSKVNTKQLQDVMQSIKKAKIGDVRYDSTEALLLDKALGNEPTSLIGDGGEHKSSITKIINEISNDKQNKDITIEREKIAIDSLKKKIAKLEEVGIEETLAITFDEETLARINAIAENKANANHKTSTALILAMILVGMFLVIWLLTFILTDLLGLI